MQDEVDSVVSGATAAVQPTRKVRQLVPRGNYREHFGVVELGDLRLKIRAAGGVLQPILVRPHPTIEQCWEIVAGERRWRCAAAEFGEDYDMPLVIKDLTDAQADAMSLIENIGRDNPSLIEEARAAAKLLAANNGDRLETINMLGWTDESTLDRRLLLLNCAAEVQEAIVKRHPNLKLGHAELLAGLPADRQVKVLQTLLLKKVSVEETKRQLGQFSKVLAEAHFDTAQCSGCQHNSAQQSGLFDESLGAGYCMHPTHYAELTAAALEAEAVPLRERFQVVKIVRAEDGHIPLIVEADGAVGVGAEQLGHCKSCANFGCTLSAIPGHMGEVKESQCFDAVCHSGKVAERRRAERAEALEAKGQMATKGAKQEAPAIKSVAPDKGPAKSKLKEELTNAVPPKVATYRTERWREWLANALMHNGERNKRALAALVLARDTRAITAERFEKAAQRATGIQLKEPVPLALRGALERADAFADDAMESVIRGVAASAAFGVEPDGLIALLNYLEVDEASSFTLSREYMELLTVSELEVMAEQVGIKRAMGESFGKARAGKRSEFIDALSSVAGFEYRGALPVAMRYRRKPFTFVERAAPGGSVGPATATEA